MIVGVAHMQRCRRLQRALERAGKNRQATSLRHVLDQVDDHFRVQIEPRHVEPEQPRAKRAPWPFPVSAHHEKTSEEP